MTTPADDLRAEQALEVLRAWGEARLDFGAMAPGSGARYGDALAAVNAYADSLVAALKCHACDGRGAFDLNGKPVSWTIGHRSCAACNRTGRAATADTTSGAGRGEG